MKKHYETHVEDTDKLISVAGPVLDYKSWYEQYRKLMEEQAQRKYGLYTPTSEGDDDDFPSIYLTANGDSISNTSFILEGNNYRDTWSFGKATTIQAPLQRRLYQSIQLFTNPKIKII